MEIYTIWPFLEHLQNPHISVNGGFLGAFASHISRPRRQGTVDFVRRRHQEASAGGHPRGRSAARRIQAPQGTGEKSHVEGERKEVMLTRNSSQTMVERIRRDSRFAKGVLSEAASLFLGGEPETARLMLRDIVNGTLGFETLSEITGIPPKSLHRMLSSRGNPGMDSLAAIFEAMSSYLKVEVEARAKKAA